MMVWTNSGVFYLISLDTNNQAPEDWVAKLFVNNHTPAVTDLPVAYTECTCPGYLPITTVPANWTGIAAGGVATFNYPTLTFTITSNPGAQTIYGYYVLSASTGALLGAELFPVPVVFPIGVVVTLNLTYKVQKCP